jgi:hypothetical protein
LEVCFLDLADLWCVDRAAPGERERVSALEVHVGLQALLEFKLTVGSNEEVEQYQNIVLAACVEIDVTSMSLMNMISFLEPVDQFGARANYRAWAGIHHPVNTGGERIRVIMLICD